MTDEPDKNDKLKPRRVAGELGAKKTAKKKGARAKSDRRNDL
jgi:hypothetical protein